MHMKGHSVVILVLMYPTMAKSMIRYLGFEVLHIAVQPECEYTLDWHWCGQSVYDVDRALHDLLD